MTVIRKAVLIALLAALGGCGGVDLTCDDVRIYQLAQEGTRVEAPDDLNNLDPLKEVPLPDASPRDEPEPGAPCIDRPPPAVIGK